MCVQCEAERDEQLNEARFCPDCGHALDRPRVAGCACALCGCVDQFDRSK